MYKKNQIILFSILIIITCILVLKFLTIVVNNDLFLSFQYLISRGNSAFDIKVYTFIYSTLVFIFYMVINNDQYYILNKYNSRKIYYFNYRLNNIIFTAVMFVILLNISLTIYAMLKFGLDNLIFFNFFSLIINSMIFDMLYFILILIIYSIIVDLGFSNITSLIITEAFICFNYLIDDRYITIVDIPSQYSSINITHNMYNLLPNIIFIIFIIIIMFYLNYLIFKKKDII